MERADSGLSNRYSSLRTGCAARRVSGGFIFRGNIMKIQAVSKNSYVLTVDDKEMDFLLKEAEDNDLTIIEIFEMLLGMLFIGGYSNVVGKD